MCIFFVSPICGAFVTTGWISEQPKGRPRFLQFFLKKNQQKQLCVSSLRCKRQCHVVGEQLQSFASRPLQLEQPIHVLQLSFKVCQFVLEVLEVFSQNLVLSC